jgi:hypothetical protein
MMDKDLLTGKSPSIEIGLMGIEYAFAKGHRTISEVEKYNLKTIPLETKILRPISKTSNSIYQGSEEHIENDFVQKYVIPFSIKIPFVTNKSYVASYSEYFWVLNFKMNIALSRDIHSEMIIEIV